MGPPSPIRDCPISEVQHAPGFRSIRQPSAFNAWGSDAAAGSKPVRLFVIPLAASLLLLVGGACIGYGNVGTVTQTIDLVVLPDRMTLDVRSSTGNITIRTGD